MRGFSAHHYEYILTLLSKMLIVQQKLLVQLIKMKFFLISDYSLADRSFFLSIFPH